MISTQLFDELLRSNNIPIVGVSGKPPSLRIDFAAGATQAQRDQANTLAGSFNWLDTLDPNPRQFIIDVTTDPGITANQKQSLHIMALWFRLSEKGLALLVWNSVKATATAGQVSTIQTLATNSNISLP